METPLVFIIFNRPTETKKVFEVIRLVKPKNFFVIADGPRTESESKLCEETRAIIESIDWECEVKKNYSETNLGCKKRISTGLDWVFENADRAIILEDDCLPDLSFFPFCEQLLNYYEKNENVMHISGNFFQQKNNQFQSINSYCFSILPHIWGWATWRRAWKHYDVNIDQWPKIQKNGDLKKIFGNAPAYEYWSRVWGQYYRKEIDSWDGQWFFACITNNGLSINPTVNLVSNIGFGDSATHTKKQKWFSNLPTRPINFPLIHPEGIGANHIADSFTFKNNFGIEKKWYHPITLPIKERFPHIYSKIQKILKKK